MHKGIGGHQSAAAGTVDWISPPEIIKPLGKFDLDPCASLNQPWKTADKQYTINDNGLILPWIGRVWLNPPYGAECIKWMGRMAEHMNGIALIFARTETKMFFDHVWPKASSLLFIEGRLHFYGLNASGEMERAKANAGGPSVLIAYGNKNVDALQESGIDGAHIIRNYKPVFVVGVSITWRKAITMSFEKIGASASVSEIYQLVERLAPQKVRGNDNYKAKIRQQLQMHFNRIKKGEYSLN